MENDTPIGDPHQIQLQLDEIVALTASNPQGLSIGEIAAGVNFDLPHRRLRFRLEQLLHAGRIVATGSKRWRKYQIPVPQEDSEEIALTEDEQSGALAEPELSPSGLAARERIRRPLSERQRVGYNRDFLDQYQPNITSYLSAEDKDQLEKLGRTSTEPRPAGTYARQFLDRLLIDLSWNSSRLEGNTYSLLDTKRLIRFGKADDCHRPMDAIMILNHKDAIQFVVEHAEEVQFSRSHIRNIHAILADDLLDDPDAPGRLREHQVGIDGSNYMPLELPQVIEECFETIMTKARAIENPFEQAFFAMVHLPYLQPFDDVNKRTSRLAANIPLIRDNLAPFSFNDVPTQSYVEAILAVYELNEVALLRDVFVWAYAKSADRYVHVRQELGEPDPFRTKYQIDRNELVRELVREKVPKREVVDHVAKWAESHIVVADRERFREMVEGAICAIDDGNYARFRITPDEFRSWDAVWNVASKSP